MGNAVLFKQSKKVLGSPANWCVHKQKCDPTVSDKQAHYSTIMVTFLIGLRQRVPITRKSFMHSNIIIQKLDILAEFNTINDGQ